jgi:hypothetical protein
LLAGDLPGLEARGADVEPLRRAGDDGAHPLDVGVEAALSSSVRVGDVVPESRPLGADVTDGGHGELLRTLTVEIACVLRRATAQE